MNYIIKMMNGDKITISEETFTNIASLPTISGLIKVKEMAGMVNLSSAVSILPEELSDYAEERNPEKTIRKRLGDGTNAIRRNGTWYDEDRDGVKLDLGYYKELVYKPKEYEQLQSGEKIYID